MQRNSTALNMSPKKQPSTLLQLCIKKSIIRVCTAIHAIERKYPENKYSRECTNDALSLRSYLLALLPIGVFDALCAEKIRRAYWDPSIKLLVLTHPNMTVFRKSDHENSVSTPFWLRLLPKLSNLVILDLEFICSDELLEVIGQHCLKLEEINIVSSVGYYKTVYTRTVTDAGLKSVANLKQLKILYMDCPRNERHSNLRGRPGVSQTAIVILISSLPCLQELCIDNFDIGVTLVNTKVEIESLSLRKIYYHFPAGEGIKKLLKICPDMQDLSVTHISVNHMDEVLHEITNSNLKLNRLDLPFFYFTDAFQQFLTVKGSCLTNLCLWDSERSLSFNTLVCIGQCCPNLKIFFFISQSRGLGIPDQYQKPAQMFSKLQELTMGNRLFKIEDMLCFFFEDTNVMQKLVVKYQTKAYTTSRIKTKIDKILLHLLHKGRFINMHCLWLDCVFEVSKGTVMEIINECDHLRMLTLNLNGRASCEIHKYIGDNNLDLRLGSY